jgi:exopolyphosphatase/guanosine-5'-triphosphate,3'-diphosphate pyrophosphatase
MKRYGILDIGSNTIKGFAYEIQDGLPTAVGERYVYAYLISYVKDGLLTQEGINRLIAAGKELIAYLREQNCSVVYALATSAIRDAENGKDAIDLLRNETGISVDILTEAQEAACDSRSLMAYAKKTSGVGLDLGGGSGQIFAFENGSVTQSVSLPIGVLRTKDQYVSGGFPTEDEYERMTNYIQTVLSSSGFVPPNEKHLLMMGGTAVTLFTVLCALGIADEAGRASVPISYLRRAKQSLTEMGDDAVAFLERHASGRVYTTLPGITVLLAIGTWLGIESYGIYSCGVREGYLLNKLEES